MQWQKQVDTGLGMCYTHAPCISIQVSCGEGAAGMRCLDSKCGDNKTAFGETTTDCLRFQSSATSVVFPFLGVLTLPLFYSWENIAWGSAIVIMERGEQEENSNKETSK